MRFVIRVIVSFVRAVCLIVLAILIFPEWPYWQQVLFAFLVALVFICNDALSVMSKTI